MSREKGSIFKKVFFYKKGPSHSPLTSTTDSSHSKPDRCAGECRQESSLCVVKLLGYVFFCGFRDVKTERQAFFFCKFVFFSFSLSWRRGSCSVWLLAECTVHVEISGEGTGVGEGDTGNRKEEEVPGAERSGQS